LCSQHLAVEKQKDTTNVYAPLIRNSQGLQTAQGITYPASPLLNVSIKNEATDSVEDSNLVPGSDSLPQSSPDEASTQKTKPDSASVSHNTWDPSIPEPDPRKKPS